LQFSWSGKAFEFNSTGSSYFQIALIIRNRDINDLMQKRKQLLELIAKGERNIKQGKTLSHEKAKDRLTKLK
jgi:hypothetical protein